MIRRASSHQALVAGYQKLAAARCFFSEIQVLDFTEMAAVFYAELLRQKIRIGTQDLRIAAIVLSINGILVTRNRKDFTQIPGLQLEDWSTNS